MFERRGRVAKAYPNPAHPMQQSRSAHLLSIRLEQHGLRSTPRRMSTWSSRNAVVFLSCRSTTSSDSEKLFVVRCGISRELHRVTTESFCAVDGVRARQSRKPADLVKNVTINQIHTT